MLYKGLKFGMILQLAIGPMCLLVFNTAAKQGLIMALSLVSAIALVDALFILLSGIGVSAVLNKPKIKRIVKIFGACVLILFGINISLSVFDISILPKINLFRNVTTESIFWQGILLTASNPLTIIFWSGVFSTQIIENNYNKEEMAWFGVGCVLATVLFLSFVGVIGVFIRSFINNQIMNILNFSVGIFIAYFGIKLAIKKV